MENQVICIEIHFYLHDLRVCPIANQLAAPGSARQKLLAKNPAEEPR